MQIITPEHKPMSTQRILEVPECVPYGLSAT